MSMMLLLSMVQHVPNAMCTQTSCGYSCPASKDIVKSNSVWKPVATGNVLASG